MKISLIQPGRNNLKYLKWSYDSIRKNEGDHEVEICVADDFSNDGTWDWCQEMIEKDPLFKAIRNEGPTRLGHTILYDTLVNEVATNDICMIYHADMYLCPGALDAIESNMFNTTHTGDALYRQPIEKVIVSLTRIEPPLHPDGPEKIGGHDAIFAPQSKEDTDIFNRFHLNGIKFVQTWEGFVYHMTCRGSRFADGAKRNPNGEVFMKNRETDEWLKQNAKSTREFLRKWGHFCNHDQYMKPIVPPKYKVAFKIKNCTEDFLRSLEPWCDHVFVDYNFTNYILHETQHTSFDLIKRVLNYHETSYDDVIIDIDAKNFTRQDNETISKLPEILDDSGEIGEFQLGNLKITINNLKTYENELIKIK